MTADFDLKNWPETVERIPKTPAGRALDAKIVTEADLLRPKAIARLHALGLPHAVKCPIDANASLDRPERSAVAAEVRCVLNLVVHQ